jgi:hypothetical protein
MFALMQQYYAGMQREVIDVYLNEKPWVIEITDSPTGRLQGFSTQMLLRCRVRGRPVLALFSGDTIVARDYWGHNPLAGIWGNLALSLIDTCAPGEFCCWFLLSKGYKTYRFLPLFFHEYCPRCDQPAHGWLHDVVDELATIRYSQSYDASAGIVRASRDDGRLREGIADVSAPRLRDRHVRYFIERNPGHARGDELCCLAPLTRENFTPAAYRVIRAQAHSPLIVPGLEEQLDTQPLLPAGSAILPAAS